MTSKLLTVKDLRKSYGDLEILKGISFDLLKGEAKAIIGPSGTGKSTLLRCINQLTPPDSGQVWLDGLEITNLHAGANKIRQQIGMVFQNFNLFKHLTALENVRIGLIKVKKMKKTEATERALEKLAQVGMADKRASYPAQLSGGQQQRVAIARALALNPKLVLFDEPTSALDPELIGEVLNVITDLASSGMTMLVVTHEMGFARSACDEIIFIEGGKTIEAGPVRQFFENPKHERTRSFMQKIGQLYGGGGK